MYQFCGEWQTRVWIWKVPLSLNSAQVSQAASLFTLSLSCQHTLIAKESGKECEKKPEKLFLVCSWSAPCWLCLTSQTWDLEPNLTAALQLLELCAVEKSDPMLMTLSSLSHSARNWISHRPCNHQLFISATQKSINSRIVSIANWILQHQISSIPSNFRKKSLKHQKQQLWRILKKSPANRLDWFRPWAIFRVYISEAVMYIASFTLM